MKHIFTLLMISGVLGHVYAQRETSPDKAKQPDIPVSPGTFRLPESSKTSTTAGTPKTYEHLIAEADNYYNNKQYDLAATRYKEALYLRNEVYPNEQLLRIEAEQAKARKDQAVAVESTTEAAGSDTDQEQRMLAQQQWQKMHRKNPDDLYSVHFTGLLLSDHYSPETYSRIDSDDPYSNLLNVGRYNDLKSVLNEANRSSLDGIAVPPGIRLIVYRNNNFTGDVLLDITGPALVNNTRLEHVPLYMNVNTETFSGGLQTIYPPSFRMWSETDMNDWVNGSMEIIAL